MKIKHIGLTTIEKPSKERNATEIVVYSYKYNKDAAYRNRIDAQLKEQLNDPLHSLFKAIGDSYNQI